MPGNECQGLQRPAEFSQPLLRLRRSLAEYGVHDTFGTVAQHPTECSLAPDGGEYN